MSAIGYSAQSILSVTDKPQILAQRVLGLYARARNDALTTVFQKAMAAAEIAPDHPLSRAGRMIATVIDNNADTWKNSFHSPSHFKEVVINAHVLLHLTQSLVPGLSQDNRAVTLSAALMHDFRHPGTRNQEPFELEKRSLLGAHPYLTMHGVEMGHIRQIEYAVLGTDLAAHSQLALHPETGIRSSRLIASILADADILTSTGLKPECAYQQDLAVNREWGTKPSSERYRNFLDQALLTTSTGGRTFHSPGGQFFNANIPLVERGVAALMAAAIEAETTPRRHGRVLRPALTRNTTPT
jgi:hypothetical protein